MTSDSISGLLLDCDYIISLAIENESTHQAAKAINRAFTGIPQFILRPVAYELATVLSRKFNHSLACSILRDVEQSEIGWLNIDTLESVIWQEFYARNRKSTSFFDCANLAAAKHYGLKIASFDRFYPAQMLAGTGN